MTHAACRRVSAPLCVRPARGARRRTVDRLAGGDAAQRDAGGARRGSARSGAAPAGRQLVRPGAAALRRTARDTQRRCMPARGCCVQAREARACGARHAPQRRRRAEEAAAACARRHRRERGMRRHSRHAGSTKATEGGAERPGPRSAQLFAAHSPRARSQRRAAAARRASARVRAPPWARRRCRKPARRVRQPVSCPGSAAVAPRRRRLLRRRPRPRGC